MPPLGKSARDKATFARPYLRTDPSAFTATKSHIVPLKVEPDAQERAID